MLVGASLNFSFPSNYYYYYSCISVQSAFYISISTQLGSILILISFQFWISCPPTIHVVPICILLFFYCIISQPNNNHDVLVMFFSFLLAIIIIVMLLHCSAPTLCQLNACGRIAQFFICIQLLILLLYFCSICISHFYFYSISTYFNTNLIPILDQLSTNNNPCCSHLYSLVVLLLHYFTTQ